MEKYCLSCAVPLGSEDFKGPAEDYCKHCTDERGQLKPFEEILAGMNGSGNSILVQEMVKDNENWWWGLTGILSSVLA